MGLEISKPYSSYFFMQSEPNFKINQAVIREYKVINILAIWQKLKILWYFEILIWESMENSKKCKILKTADRRAKLMKIWESCSYVLPLQGAISDSLSLVWGHSLHFAKFPMLIFRKVTASTIFIQFQPNFMEGKVIRGEYGLLLFGNVPNFKKIMAL